MKNASEHRRKILKKFFDSLEEHWDIKITSHHTTPKWSGKKVISWHDMKKLAQLLKVIDDGKDQT